MKKSLVYLLVLLSKFWLLVTKLMNRGFDYNSQGIVFVRLKVNGSARIILKSGYLVNSKIIVTGNNNVILFDDNVKITNCQFIIKGDNCLIDFRGNRVMINSKFELLDSNTKLIVKNNTGFNNNRILVAGIGNEIKIGSGCIFAENAEVWSSDTHSILDVKTSSRINLDKPIFIGDNVWIGNRALIFKGVIIGDNTIIGAGSIVTKDVENNTLVAGIPAKVVKENVKWDINRL